LECVFFFGHFQRAVTLISLVYAQSRNGIIGAEGGLPWHLPSDLKRFKETTLGKPIIMGRKTWDGLPRRPLPGRVNIVVTRQTGFVAEGAVVVSTPDAAVLAAGDTPEICVIGGGEIYSMFLPLAGRIYLTEVDIDVVGDTRAPVLNAGEWHEVSFIPAQRGEKDNAAFSTRVLERVRL
jgi:dihydrofolate reductase